MKAYAQRTFKTTGLPNILINTELGVEGLVGDGSCIDVPYNWEENAIPSLSGSKLKYEDGKAAGRGSHSQMW